MKIGRQWWVLATAVVSAFGLALLAMTLVSAGAFPSPQLQVTAGSVPLSGQGTARADLGPPSGQPEPTASDAPPPMPLPIWPPATLSAALLQQQMAEAKPCPASLFDPSTPKPAPSTFVMPPIPGQPGAKICVSQGCRR